MAAPRLAPVRHQPGKLRPRVQHPLHTRTKSRNSLEELWFERLDREQRNQTHHRSHLERRLGAIRQVEHVVEELVLFIPQSHALLTANGVHGLSNVQKMLEEFAGDVLIGVIVLREFKRYT